MYATCTHGHRHWGTAGAAGGLVLTPTDAGPRILMTLRSAAVHQGGTWSLPGGAIDPGDADAHAAACREIDEELDLDVRALPVLGEHVFDCGGWTYTTVLLAAAEPVPVATDGWETDEVHWLTVAEVDALAGAGRLHPGFATSWPELRRLVAERVPAAR